MSEQTILVEKKYLDTSNIWKRTWRQKVIKQQNNGPKPWFKVPKVCPDPKGVVFTNF